MPTVFDAACYILQKQGEMTALKLHKLLYYAQAWSLAWDEKPLFSEPVEAWGNGPMIPALYAAHDGLFKVSVETFRGDPTVFSADEQETLEVVLQFYGDKKAYWLTELARSEDPWKQARINVKPGDRGGAISWSVMGEYYRGLEC